jgi:hypothetical protein
LAFTTIPGASATDKTSFIGTDAVDILTTFATLSGYVEAQEANDVITLSNSAGLVDWTVRGLDGNDNITANSDLIGGLFNGNKGLDNITLDGVFGGARVLGGPETDIIATGSGCDSRVNGNKGDDTITVTGSVSGGTVYGGQGQDTITVDATAAGSIAAGFANTSGSLTNGMIDGNLGGAVITVLADATSTISNFEVVGGELGDLIDASAVLGGAAAAAVPATAIEGFTIKGLEGADVITGTGRDDTIEGGLGDDFIDGEFGADKLTGGAGQNTFAFGGGLETWVGSLTGGPAGEPIVVDATDEIVDWGKGIGATGVAANFIDLTGNVVLANDAVNAYATVSKAVNAINPAAGNATVVAIGTAGAYSSYLLIENGAIKLGGGVYATVAAATDIDPLGGAVIAQANII